RRSGEGRCRGRSHLDRQCGGTGGGGTEAVGVAEDRLVLTAILGCGGVGQGERGAGGTRDGGERSSTVRADQPLHAGGRWVAVAGRRREDRCPPRIDGHIGGIVRDCRRIVDRQRGGTGGGCADAVGEDRVVLIIILGGSGVADGQGGAGGTRNGSERIAAVGAHLPLHGGRGVAAGRRREGRRLPGIDGQAGGTGCDRLIVDRQRGGRGGGGTEAGGVAEDRLVLRAVEPGGDAGDGQRVRGDAAVDPRIAQVGPARGGVYLPLHGGGRWVAVAGRRREGRRLASGHRQAGGTARDRRRVVDRQCGESGGGTEAGGVAEDRLVLRAVEPGGDAGDGQRVRGDAAVGRRIAQVGPARAGVHLPQHGGGRWVAVAGRRREGRRCRRPGIDRQAGGTARDCRSIIDRQCGGIGGGTEAGGVAEDRLVLRAVEPGGDAGDGQRVRGDAAVGRRIAQVGPARAGVHLPQHGGGRWVAVAGRRREGRRLAGVDGQVAGVTRDRRRLLSGEVEDRADGGAAGVGRLNLVIIGRARLQAGQRRGHWHRAGPAADRHY